MEKENVILTDDELKDISGGDNGWNDVKGCNLFNRRDICEHYVDKCYWNMTLHRCIAK